MSTIETDSNGFQTVDPTPTAAGAAVIQENTDLTSSFVTSFTSSIGGNTSGVAANAAGIAGNDTDILTLQRESQAISVTNYSTTGDGVADDRTALFNANAATAAAGKWLVFPPGTYRVNSDLTFTVPVLFTGGIIRLAAGVTVTFNQPYMNPSKQQCFDEQGRITNVAGGVRLAVTNPQSIVRPEDWGAAADDVTNGQEVFIQQAIDSFNLYPRSSLSKLGKVVFSSGTYLCANPIFCSYDWVTKTADWANKEFAAWRNHADTAQGLQQPVLLEGEGFARLEYTGAVTGGQDNLASDPALYFVYTSSNSNARGHKLIENLTLACNWNIRGLYCSGWRYGSCIDGLTVYQSQEVGLEWVECWGAQLKNIFFQQVKGISLRGRNANNCTSDTIQSVNYGHQDDFWPLPTDQTVRQSTGSVFVQTKVWERGAIDVLGSVTQWLNTMVESSSLGTAMAVEVAADNVTCTQIQHGFTAGDPIYLHEDDTATTVASVTNSSTFVVTDAFVGTGSQLVYRRATSITQANPAVVNCVNHGLAEGAWVKIIAATGMTNVNDTWYRVKFVDADSFQLWTAWDDDGGTGSALNSSGFNASDGTEYLVSSAYGIVVAGQGSTLRTIRFENDSILRANMLIPTGHSGITIDSALLDSVSEGVCDYVVEMQSVAQNHRITRMIGNGIDKAVVTHSSITTATRKAAGCVIENNRTYLARDQSTFTDAIVEWNGEEEGNTVEGASTAIKYTNPAGVGDVSLSVYGEQFTAKLQYNNPLLELRASFDNSIDNFTDGHADMTLRVFFLGGSATVRHNATIVLTGGVDLSPAANTMLTFHNLDGVWYQV